jgi:hypothetical protein
LSETCGSEEPEHPEWHCQLDADNHRLCWCIADGEVRTWDNPNWRERMSGKRHLAEKAPAAREHLASLAPPEPEQPDRTVRSKSAPEPRARNSDPETSHDAARFAKFGAEDHRGVVLLCLADAYPDGLTDFEVDERTARIESRKRRTELVELRYVESTEERRRSPRGVPAIVWRATEAGVAHARTLS